MSARPTRGAIGRGTDFDSHDFSRPSRHSRPRTKERPDYSDAPSGRVIGVDRGRYRVLLEGREYTHELTATKSRRIGRKGVIVGDVVRLTGDTSGRKDTLGRIVEVEPRRTVLNRTADDTDPTERPIVANADQLMMVASLADPPARPGMIDRVLVAGYVAAVAPIICLTKSDLTDPAPITELYEPLGVPIVICEPGSDLSELKSMLASKVTVLVGHSGVGKSTLINRLVPDAERRTGHVNDVTGKGRQTSTSVVALRLPALEGRIADPGWVIDTPGVRSFGLSNVSPEAILAGFTDLAEFVADCPRGCNHHAGAPECGLDAALAGGELSPERLVSFRRILDAVDRPAYENG
ncbi:ribosome small subunit-dependent GTPase A [Propionibacterium sp.]|uniref:ribosome small subunit-dependent GTPase A n=1 Tax=Propionibacterium sp. TaxID=1977903 RepID=UPI0039EAD492